MAKSEFLKVTRLCWRCMKGSAGNNEYNLCLECRKTTQQMNKHHPYVMAVFDVTNGEILIAQYETLIESGFQRR